MLNSPETYFEAGETCGRARKHKDESLARFQRQWFARALELEERQFRAAAVQMWELGYAAGRGKIGE